MNARINGINSDIFGKKKNSAFKPQAQCRHRKSPALATGLVGPPLGNSAHITLHGAFPSLLPVRTECALRRI